MFRPAALRGFRVSPGVPAIAAAQTPPPPLRRGGRDAAAACSRRGGVDGRDREGPLRRRLPSSRARTPDWSHLRTIFLPGARLTPPKRPGGRVRVSRPPKTSSTASPRGSPRAAPRGAASDKGFVEREISRSADCFGNVCQVFSTYEGAVHRRGREALRARHQLDPARQGRQPVVGRERGVGPGGAGEADPARVSRRSSPAAGALRSRSGPRARRRGSAAA